MTMTNSYWAWAAWMQFWQVTALILAVWLMVRIGCRRRPHLAHLLWVLVILKCLTPPVWSSPTGVFSWIQRSTSSLAADDRLLPAEAVASEEIPIPAVSSANVLTHVEPPAVRETRVSPASFFLSRPFVLFFVWLAGAVLFSASLFFKWFRFRDLLKNSAAPVDSALEKLVGAWARKLGVRRRVRLLVMRDPIGPASLGLFAPAVLMPVAIVRGKRPEELEPMLAHELIHIRRGDQYTGLLQLLAQVIWWFHPLVWMANREACRECERCCDEETVAELGCAPAVYARCLLDVVDQKQTLQPAFAWPGMQAAHVTAQRLKSIMHRGRPLQRRTPGWCWCLMLTATAFVLPGAELVTGKQPTSPHELTVQAVGREAAPNQQPEQDRSSQPKPDDKPLSELIKDLESNDLATCSKAADVIGTQGPKAKAAVPALRKAVVRLHLNPQGSGPKASMLKALWHVDRAAYVKILENKADPCRWDAIFGLVALGVEAKEMMPILIAIAKDPTDSPNREHAMMALGFIGADPDVVVPVLVEGLQVGQYARCMSAQALANLGPAAKAALPALHATLSDPSPRDRVEAAGAIWKIEKQAKDILPVLQNALSPESDSEGARYPAIVYLGLMGPDAKPAFPTLLKLWQEDKKNPKPAIATALKKIDHEAAEKAGVK